ncbi:MAG TPA: PAS domain-containing protein [Acidimicrobiales bacterium]|nr:PAS domain-containing protein [Acidimicrobiales bacterium]
MSLFDLPASITALAERDEAVVIVNLEGVVVLANAAAEEVFGVPIDDMVGEYAEMLVPKSRRWGHQAYRRGYFAEPSSREMDPGLDPFIERPDGSKVRIHVWLEPHKVDGEYYVESRITTLDGEVEE